MRKFHLEGTEESRLIMNKFLANFGIKLFDKKKKNNYNSQSKKQLWKIIRGCGGSMFKLKFCKLVYIRSLV